MAIPSTIINYPLSTINVKDEYTNVCELKGSRIKITDGTSGENVNINTQQIKVTLGVDPNVYGYIGPAIVNIHNGEYYSIGSATDGFTTGDDSGYTRLKRNQLLTDGAISTFDMSFNALSFRNVASGGAGEVVMSDASGAPYWSSLSLNDISNANQAEITNVKSIQFTDASAGESVTIKPINVTAGVETINISTSADISGSAKEFSRAYLPIGVGGVVYYLPLFSVPV